MKALILADIHGNGEALRTVLKDAEQLGFDEVWFLGDLCGYGPDIHKCFLMLNKFKLIFLAGNHDLYMTGDMEKDFFSDMARISLILGRSDVSPALMGFLSDQSARMIHRGIELVHGSPADPAVSYILNERDAAASLPYAQKKTVLFGHTHVQEYYYEDKEMGLVREKPSGDPISLKGRHILINPGSVGQPRDGDNRAAWGLLDTRKREFSFFRTPYNFEVTQQKMKERGYPDFLVERLAVGQ